MHTQRLRIKQPPLCAWFGHFLTHLLSIKLFAIWTADVTNYIFGLHSVKTVCGTLQIVESFPIEYS